MSKHSLNFKMSFIHQSTLQVARIVFQLFIVTFSIAALTFRVYSHI